MSLKLESDVLANIIFALYWGEHAKEITSGTAYGTRSKGYNRVNIQGTDLCGLCLLAVNDLWS